MNELDLINAESAKRTEKAVIESEIRRLSAERRRVAALADAETAKPLHDAHDTAAAKVASRRQTLAEAEANVTTLRERLSDGDDSVSEQDLALAKASVERGSLLLPSAEANLVSAEADLRPFLSDNELAYLAADVIEPIVDVPVFIHKRTEDVPYISAALILSQVEPTRDYGTVAASGSVEIAVIGDADRIDWRAIRQAFADAGCEVTISPERVVFHVAAWPLVRLVKPSAHAIAELAHLFSEAWATYVDHDARDAARLRAAGFQSLQTLAKGPQGLSIRRGETFAFADGLATGVAKLSLSVDAPYADFTCEHLEADVRSLVDLFVANSVGNVTEAGEIVGIELTSVERGDGSVWGGAVKWGVSGHPIYPATIDVEITATYRHQPAEAVG